MSEEIAKSIEVAFTPLEEFEFWLEEMEDKVVSTVKKPKNRAEACQLLTITKKLKRECDRKEKPEGLFDGEDDKADELLGRYNLLKATLNDNYTKADTLVDCWNKINEDMTSLTKALSSGGDAKMTMDKLEKSIEEIKDTFRERANIIDNLTPAEL